MKYNENDKQSYSDLIFSEKSLWQIQNSEIHNTELNFYHCGEHECEGEHAWGPAVRDQYLIHFIVSGHGIFRVRNKTYALSPGNGFLICPGQVVFYQADKVNPWHYYWVGFNGINAQKILHQAGLGPENPILYSTDVGFFVRTIEDMATAAHHSEARLMNRMGHLYLLLSKLIEIAPHRDATGKRYNPSIAEEYVKNACDYVEKHMYYDISVNELASYIGISRKYLYTIFMKVLRQTPIEYILTTRMDKACTLLMDPRLLISEVSNSVGYVDQFTFSKQFKKTIGLSPTEYRNQRLAVSEESLP